MFNAMEGLNDTCERIAGLSLAGENRGELFNPNVASSRLMFPNGSSSRIGVSRRTKRDTAACRNTFSSVYATTEDRQDRVPPRGLAMRMVLFREYLASLDRWSMGKDRW